MFSRHRRLGVRSEEDHYELNRVVAVLAADTRGDECADEMARGLRETVTAGMLSLNDLCWWMEQPVLLRPLDLGHNGDDVPKRPARSLSLKRFSVDFSNV